MDTLRLQVILSSIDNATKPLQGILKGTSALGKQAKETRDRLRELNAQNKQLESFRNTTARVTETAQAMQAARDKVRGLGEALAAAEAPSARLQAELKALTAQRTQLDTFSRALGTVSDTARHLDAAREKVRNLGAELAATDRPTLELTQDYKLATAQLAKLERAHVAATKAQRQATADMQRAGIPITELASRQRALNDQIGATTRQLEQQAAQRSRTQALAAEYKAATRDLRHLTTAHDQASQAQRAVTADMQRAGIPVTELANRQQHLAREIAAATAQLERQGSQINRVKTLQASYRNTLQARDRIAGAAVSTGAVGAATGGAVISTLKAYAEAEDAGTRLAASMMQVGGVVPAQYKQINELATRLGDKLPGTTADYQNMMQMLIRQGMSAKTILGGLGEATAYLAVQLDMPKQAAAEFAAKLQDATRTTEGDMMRLMDVIQRTYYLGVDSTNMLNGFSKLSPALSIIRKEGLEASKALAPLLVMADQAGMEGGAAGNAYRKIFQMAMSVKNMGKANATLAGKDWKGRGQGVQLDFTDGKGEFGGMDEFFAQLEQMKKLDTQIRIAALKEGFGDDAETLQALTLIIEKGKAGYDEVVGKMQAQADLQRRVDAQLSTLRALWESTTGTFTNLLASLGESIAPQVKWLTQFLGDAAAGVRRWATENPRLATTLMQIIAFLAIVTTAVGALLLAVSAVLGPFALFRFAVAAVGLPGFITTLGTLASTALPMVATALRTLAALATAHPIVALITALAGAATYVWANWDTLGPKFAAWWDKLKTLFAGGVQYVLDKIAAIKQFLGISVDYKQIAPPVTAQPPLRAAGGNTTLTTTHNITVNTAPGQSPTDVAHAVRTELDARDRQRAAQRRSIFADTN